MIDQNEFRKSWSYFPTGVSIVATKDQEQEILGMTANSIMSVSLNPPIIIVSVGNERSILKHMKISDLISVSILSQNQSNIAEYFSKPNNETSSFFKEEENFFYIKDSVCCFFCERIDSIEIGDHTLFPLKVTKIQFDNKNPLIWFKGKFQNNL